MTPLRILALGLTMLVLPVYAQSSPTAGAASNTYNSDGCILDAGDSVVISDPTGRQVFELRGKRGAKFSRHVGKRSGVIGVIDTSATPKPGAVKAAKGGMVQVVTVASLKADKDQSQSVCDGLAKTLGISAVAGSGAAVAAGAATSASVASAAGAAAAAGIAVPAASVSLTGLVLLPAEGAAAAVHGIGSAFRRRVTGSLLLLQGTREPSGFGLYSYILYGTRPESINSSEWRRYYEANRALLNLPTTNQLGEFLPKSQLNATFLPVRLTSHELSNDQQGTEFHFAASRLQAHSLEHEGITTPVDYHSSPKGMTACVLVDSYDYARARALLAMLPDAGGEGPYIVSTLQPLGRMNQMPQHFLFQDLSGVPPEIITLWIREFVMQAAEKEFWKSRTKEQFLLRLRTAIAVGGQEMPDLSSVVRWTFAGFVPTARAAVADPRAIKVSK